MNIDPPICPIVPKRTTSQKFKFPDSVANPEKGITTSEGTGIRALSRNIKKVMAK